jgi:lambda family phage tail tape measure protein
MGKFDMGAGAGWDAPKQRRETIEGVDPKAAAAKRELERQIKHAWELMKKGRMEELKVIEETNKALGEQSDIYRKGAYAQTARLDLESQQLDRQKEMFDLSIAGLTMRAEDLQLEQDFLQLEYKRKDAIEAINKDETLTREAKLDAIERENELYARGNLLARERNIATKATREGSFGEGFAQSAARFFRDMPTDLEQGASAFQSVMGNMESAIDKFVRTGKLGFKDLARSIIQDLISIQLRAQMTGIFKMLFPTMFPVSTGAGSMFELQNAGAGAFADGGSPPVGQASLVGERGPELFVPRTAGTIIPNNQLSNMGGTTMVTNNYINAIDTKSFEDRLLGSSNAVWAANQYAGKSLAVNRGRA